jgi:hypothetical protein
VKQVLGRGAGVGGASGRWYLGECGVSAVVFVHLALALGLASSGGVCLGAAHREQQVRLLSCGACCCYHLHTAGAQLHAYELLGRCTEHATGHACIASQRTVAHCTSAVTPEHVAATCQSHSDTYIQIWVWRLLLLSAVGTGGPSVLGTCGRYCHIHVHGQVVHGPL